MHRLAVVLFGSILAVGLTSCARTSSTSQVPSAPVYTSSTQQGLIPAGTTVEVRTNQAIDTSNAQPSGTYSAEVTREIIGGNGNVLVPKGSPAELTVVSTKEGGTLTSGEIQLALRSITVNGQSHMVETGTSKQSGNQGLGANRRTAEMVGGGAVLGTLLGAVVGGGTGAAVGAAVGAAGGAAAQVITKGDHVRVPAETLLTFRLEEPIQLR